MTDDQSWSQFHNPLGLRSFTCRLDILRRQFLNHRFERRSPLSPLPGSALARIYDSEVTFPPRRLLMQEGTQTIDGLFFLVSLAKRLGASAVFEIGTFIGLTAWMLSRNLPEAIVHTLDIPPAEDPAWGLDPSDVHRGSEGSHVYRDLPHQGEIEQHWADSAKFDFSPWQGRIDLVYVDGAHSTEYVRSDTNNALAMLSHNGAIVWDDYWRLSPGVVEVLHARKDLPLFRVPGTRLVVMLSPGASEGLLDRAGS